MYSLRIKTEFILFKHLSFDLQTREYIVIIKCQCGAKVLHTSIVSSLSFSKAGFLFSYPVVDYYPRFTKIQDNSQGHITLHRSYFPPFCRCLQRLSSKGKQVLCNTERLVVLIYYISKLAGLIISIF